MAKSDKLSYKHEKRASWTTASEREVKQFEDLAGQWWDTEGPFAPLHRINPVRLTFIRDHLSVHFSCDVTQKKPFKNLFIFFSYF